MARDRLSNEKTLIAIRASIGRVLSMIVFLPDPATRLKALQSVDFMVRAVLPLITDNEKRGQVLITISNIETRLSAANGALGKMPFPREYPTALETLLNHLFTIEQDLWNVAVPNELIIINVQYFDALGHVAVSRGEDGSISVNTEITAEQEFSKFSSAGFSVKD